MVSPSSGSSSFASRTQAETRSQQRAHTVTCVPGHAPTLPSIPGHEPTLSLIPDRYIDYDFDRELAPSPSYVGPLVDHTTYYLPSTLCHTTYYLPSTLYHIPYYHLLPCATLLTIYPLPSASAPLCFHPAVPLPCASAPLCLELGSTQNSCPYPPASSAQVMLVAAEDASSGDLVAGALHLLGGDCIYGRYWGCARHYDCLHFELCFYQVAHLPTPAPPHCPPRLIRASSTRPPHPIHTPSTHSSRCTFNAGNRRGDLAAFVPSGSRSTGRA